MIIRPANLDDGAALWAILGPTIRAGDTYALDSDMAEALSYWTGPDRETFVAEIDGRVVGTYYMRPNQAGGGRHICNCGYMTDTALRGKGIARTMCMHSLEHARTRGYRGMQFNFVVTTNLSAIYLWSSMGFSTVGRIPLAFEHPVIGFVDALVMFRDL